jgi:hypothetical protein
MPREKAPRHTAPPKFSVGDYVASFYSDGSVRSRGRVHKVKTLKISNGYAPAGSHMYYLRVNYTLGSGVHAHNEAFSRAEDELSLDPQVYDDFTIFVRECRRRKSEDNEDRIQP